MQKILIVEDNTLLAQQLNRILTLAGYSCKTAKSIDQSYSLLEAEHFDLALLDRTLPDGDSLEVIKYLEDFPKTKKIIVSNLGSTQDKINGLTVGSDDYLSKPFSQDELLLRVKKQLSTVRIESDQKIVTTHFTFYPKTGKIILSNDVHKQLRKKESAILKSLCRFKNQVVSRDTIINDVWPHYKNQPSYTSLDVYIRRIRVILADKATAIKTVRGFGYQLWDKE